MARVTDSPAVQGKYQRAVRAPRGLRGVMKLGEIERAITAVDEWRDAYARLDAAEFAMVADLRGRGGSWDSIGWLLGVSGEAVRQRFGTRVDGGDPHV
jgi:hypothetical protein